MAKEEILRDLGLSDKEIEVYLTLLALGQSSVNAISGKSGLNRVTCYDVLKSLKEKGLASYAIKSGVKYFESAEPQKLLGDLQEKERKVKSIIPELESLKSTLKEKPRIEIYEGLQGLKTVVEDVLKHGKESWFIADPEFMDALQYYFPHFISEKRKKGMFSKVITLDCKRMRDYQKKSPKKYARLKYVNERFPTTKIIYGNKVGILTFEKKNMMGIIIENRDAADAERIMFNLLWKSAST